MVGGGDLGDDLFAIGIDISIETDIEIGINIEIRIKTGIETNINIDYPAISINYAALESRRPQP